MPPLPPFPPPCLDDLGEVPQALQALKRWICFRFEWKHTRRGTLKLDKVPTDPRTGHDLPWSKPAAWMTLPGARAAATAAGLAGVGIVLVADDDLVGIDLDRCIDLATGEIAPWAAEIVNRFASYTEITPSRTGLRILLRGQLPPGRRRRDLGDGVGIEVYSQERFLTVTGRHLEKTPERVESRPGELTAWHTETFPPKPAPATPSPSAGATVLADLEVLRLALAAKNGVKFARLWEGDNRDYGENESAADAAVLGMLAFYTQDSVQLERLLRQSRRARPKWDERRGATTWLRQDIANALQDLGGETYTPPLEVDLEDAEARTNGAPPLPPTSGDDGGDAGEPKSVAPGVDGFALTDMGNAERLLAAYGRRLRYCAKWGKWLAWDGKRWAIDVDTTGVRAFARRVVRRMSRDARRFTATDKRGAVRLFRWAVKSESTGKLAAMVSQAETFPLVWVTPDDLDTDPWALNCANGTVDLRTGQLRRHDPAELLTKLTPVAYEPGATSALWEPFVADVTATADGQPDPDVAGYLQRAIGHSVTGDQSEQVVYFPHGQGANGKSTFLNAVRQALGEYAMQAGPDLLMAKDHPTHPTELTDLYRMRLVVSTELEDGRRLAEALVKQMTGGEPIRARRMREDLWQFEATHTVWVAANHKPVIRGTDHAIWRRIRLVPFDVTFYDRPEDAPAGSPARLKDTALPARLAAELPAILRWAVRGAVAWAKDGLVVPPRVREATETYRQEMDVLAAFLDERCVIVPQASAGATELYEAYKTWCDAAGEHAETQTRFGLRLTERGFGKGRGTHAQTIRLGIGLRATTPPPGAPGGSP